MEQAGVIHTLAEPNLTAISGETATFLAGGEFPILNGYSCCAVRHTGRGDDLPAVDRVQEVRRQSLNFTPVVLSEGRISLKVMTEVSDISAQNALTIPIPGTTNTCHRAVDPHAARRHHGRNSVRRLAGAWPA